MAPHRGGVGGSLRGDGPVASEVSGFVCLVCKTKDRVLSQPKYPGFVGGASPSDTTFLPGAWRQVECLKCGARWQQWRPVEVVV